LQRYTKQLDSQEDRLVALQKQAAGLKAKRAQLQSEMDDLVAKITFDEKF
jgi:predicted  nucleic acid-binding Zn-ribbon protein